MHSLLSKLFQKRNIKDFDDLDNTRLPDGSSSERENFEEWNRILSIEDLTTEDMGKFCQSQIDIIETKWADLKITNERKKEFIPYHTVYKSLLAAIRGPKVAREAVEKQLLELIK